MWNPRSVMFEVAWCVMLYNTVLALEFAPVILEKYKMTKTIKMIKRISIPLIILGVILSTLHQSSLGSLYLIVPDKMYPLWYSAYMPIFFYVSAIAAGCAMIIFESFLSSRAFNRGLELNLLTEIARICVVMLGVYAVMKAVDLNDRKMLSLLTVPRFETYMYWFEVTVGVIIPFIMFTQRKIRQNTTGLFIGAVLVVVGFIMNRMNIAITGMEGWTSTTYVPSWNEFSITMMIVTIGFIAFYFIAKYFPVFIDEHEHEDVHKHSVNVYSMHEDLKKVSSPV